MRYCGNTAFATVLIGTLLLASPAVAQSTYTLIYKFHAGANTPIGRLAEAPDGALYGTTYCGGEPGAGCAGGTLFVLRPQLDGSLSFQTLHHFRPGLHGGNPAGGLTLTRDGRLYGIATRAGRPITAEIATGTIFRLEPSGSLNVVHVFPDDSQGEDPIGRLMEGSDGNLYGATCRFGRYAPSSTLFRLTPTGSFSTIHVFRMSESGSGYDGNPLDGFCPLGELTERGGLLYGTTIAGGRPSPILPQFPRSGTLFRVDASATPAPITVLHTFRGIDGAAPTGGLTPSASGEFFGTTSSGGLFGQGVIFRLDSSGIVRNVHTFFGLDGAYPFGRLHRSADGAMYGTTLRGGLGHGTVYRVGASGFASLHWFSGADGTGPLEVMQARDGTFYGTTTSGGPGGGGTIFRMGPDHAVSTIHTFSPGLRAPYGGIIQDSDGTFYGTTFGSSFGGGAIFTLSPAGEVTMLHEFTPPPGRDISNRWVVPTGVIEGADGLLYGTTLEGGPNGRGMVYRISKTGAAFTMLHGFPTSSGTHLMRHSDGNIYGVIGGDGGTLPSIFRIDRSGRFSTVYAFEGEVGGTSVSGPLAEGPDGALYGLASGAGPFNSSGLFKVTTSGTFTFLYSFAPSFDPNDVGYRSVSGLVRGADGGLYGSTTQHLVGSPSVYRFDATANTIAAVARLYTDRPLALGRDGAIYGWSGYQNDPVLFRLFRLTQGNVEFLYDMVEQDGLNPSTVIQGVDGALYGAVSEGPWRYSQRTWPDDTFAGGVFRLTVPPVAPVRTASR